MIIEQKSRHTPLPKCSCYLSPRYTLDFHLTSKGTSRTLVINGEGEAILRGKSSKRHKKCRPVNIAIGAPTTALINVVTEKLNVVTTRVSGNHFLLKKSGKAQI